MNVLLIGGPGDLTNRLITIFSKEGHRVSLLTGSYHGVKKHERVFEQYNFPYNCNVLTEIFESISPDITVFTGICDSTFQWKDIQADALNFISATMNILNAFSFMEKGRLLFVSSDAVFRADHGEQMGEDDPVDANDLRGMTLIEAESLCERFRSAFQEDIVTVRVSGNYHLPETPDDVDDPVTRICLKAVRNQLHEASFQTLMPMFSADTAFFISRLALAPTHKHAVYHVSSGALTTEQDVAALALQELTRQRPRTEDEQVETLKAPADVSLTPERNHALLNNARFTEEFGINRLAPLGEKVGEIIASMLKKERLFLFGEEDTSNLRQRFSDWAKQAVKVGLPYVENLLCFVFIFLISGILTRSSFFTKVDIYLLYVLLFAILYGQSQAAFSAFLSVLSLLIPILGDRSMVQVFLNYGTYVWIAQLFIVGLSVGYLKDRLTVQKEEAMDDHEYMTNQVEDIREINGSNSRVKEALEIQIINHQESIGKIYDITSSLDAYHSVDVLFHATDVVRRIMGSRDIAIYVVHEGNAYARMFTATSPLARQFGNSFLYQETGEMYEAFRNRKTYINRTWDRNYPAMAIAAYDGDAISLIIMIWTLPLEKMTLGQANLLTVVCKLTQESVMRARRYYEAVRHTQVVKNTNVLLRKPFRQLVDYYDDAMEKQLTEFVVLRVMRLPEGVEATAKVLQENIRPNDYMGLGLRDDTIYVIISNTSPEGGNRVIERLKSAGLTAVNANHELI